jgi:splicing factor 3B subunit 3
MNFYHLSLSNSSFISDLITGNFDKQNPKKQQILIVKNNTIQLARIEETTGTLVTLTTAQVFGIIRKVVKVRLPGSSLDYIGIGSDSGRVSVLEYLGSGTMTKIFSSVARKSKPTKFYNR